MLIKDLIVLGRACPEPLRDGRVTVCLAGWSAELGFVRIYPTRFDAPCHQWDVIELEVERNERDPRKESWKIVGSRGEWESLSQKIRVVNHIDSSERRQNLVGNLTDPCVMAVGNAGRSLGIIKPDILRTYFRPNPSYGQMMQLGLPGMTELDAVKVKRDFPEEPRIVYRCPQCQTEARQHDQQVLEWGFYEWIRKNPDKKEQVWENARLGREDTDIYLLVGNQLAHKNSFMVISIIRVPAGDITTPMFPLPKTKEP